MKRGRIVFGPKSTSNALEKALKQIMESAPGVRLVSCGFKKRCEVCERQTHAKWHEFAKGELNPIALIEFLEANRFEASREVINAIIGYVTVCTGLDMKAARAEIATERVPAATD